jgi:radical SAM superfamily enzyme YgiQ (UPF0313 family)
MSQAKKRLILINPMNEDRKGFAIDRSSRYPPLGLGIVAALTPKDWYIRIIDENFQRFKFREADLVGITSFTSTAPRAYDIAKVYRDKGIPVVMGGIHASMMPDEAAKFADTVVTGEAEGIWSKLIEDFLSGNLQKRYKGELLELTSQPVPRHDLFHPAYIFDSVQTSRGCPFNCEFCTVSAFNGSHFRERPIDEVIRELETIQRRNIFFVDDNICGYGKRSRERAIALFKEMIDRGMNKRWFSQASLNFADDDELLHYAAKSGCRLILIGIEVEKEEGLQEFNKQMNLKRGPASFRSSFRKIQKHGITVLGTFIYGLDSDLKEDLRRRTDFIVGCGLDAIQTSILTPMPGTEVYKKILRENRLEMNSFPKDWQHYHACDVVFRPKNMSAQTLADEMTNCYHRVYSRHAIYWRFLKTLMRTKNFGASFWSFMSNTHYRNIVFEKKISVFTENGKNEK